MALFTESEAKACKIWRMRKEITGSEVVWLVKLLDGNRSYSVSLEGLGSNPSKEQLKDALVKQVITMERFPQLAETIYEDVSDKGLGENLG